MTTGDEFSWGKQERRKTDGWFRVLVDAMHEGMGVLDREGRFVFVNRRLQEILGYSDQECADPASRPTLDDESWAMVSEHLSVCTSIGGPVGSASFDLTLRARDGREVRAAVSLRCIPGDPACTNGCVLVVNDISEQEFAKDRMRTLSRTMEHCPTVVLMLHRSGRAEYVNPKFRFSAGGPEQLAAGQNLLDPAGEVVVSANFQRRAAAVLESGVSCSEEVETVDSDGELRWFRETISSVADGKGAVTHLVVTQEDVTERRKAESALQESEYRYGRLLEALPAGVYMEQEGRLIVANQRFADIFGYSGTASLIGRAIVDLIYPPDVKAFRAATAKALREGMAPVQYQVRGVKQDGSIAWIKGTGASLTTAGRPSIIGSILDVTEETAMAESLLRSERELHVLSEELFAAQEKERKRISAELHDGIGQYLSAVKYSLEEYVYSPDPRKREDPKESLKGTLGLLQDAIEEVRALAVDLRPAILDDLGLVAAMSWYCRRFQKIYAPLLVNTRIEAVEAEIPDALRIVIYRVLQEALSNVVKHAHAEQVCIHLGSSGQELLLSVEDDGCGFDVDGVVSRDGTPRGIGLLSMRERTELGGGAFLVQAQRGAGTRIHARWPLAKVNGNKNLAANF